jgi:predicted transcriptional regulator
MAANGNLTSDLPRTRCEPELRAAMDKIAAKDDRDVSFVIRRACRELVAKEANGGD